MVGPMDFTTNDECGLLVEGFERAPLILCDWHHPYYAKLIEGAGLTKAMDTLMWELRLDEVEDKGGFHPMIQEMADKVEGEHDVTVRSMKQERTWKRRSRSSSRSTTRPGRRTGASCR